MSRRFTVATSVIIFALAALAVGQIQVVQTKAKVKEHFEHAVVLLAQETKDLFTVPAHRTLVLTDVLIGNRGTESIICSVTKDGQKVLFNVVAPAGDTLQHTFATGLEFEAGTNLGFQNAGMELLSVNLLGYLRKE